MYSYGACHLKLNSKKDILLIITWTYLTTKSGETIQNN